jgi:protein-S-isoprenylcysteine O-methyltransferase Ste14
MSHRRGHGQRKDLAGEHALSDIGQLLLLFTFLTAWILDSFVFGYSTLLSDSAMLYVKVPFFVIILFCGVYLARAGLSIVFGEIRGEPAVIRKGVFGIVRHPIYLASILFYLGLLVISFSIIATGIWFLIIAFYYFNSKYEEKLLMDKFGRDYEEYKKEVPMLIPRLRKRRTE